MPTPSTIKRLPPDILSKLQQLLQDPRCTQLEATAKINQVLEAEGHPERVSKSAVNRYAVEMAEVGADLQQSREIADMWVGKFGASPSGNVGMLAVEIIRTMSFEMAMMVKRGGIDPESAPETIKMLKDLALTSMRLEKSASDNLKREQEIRKLALQDAADTAVVEVKKGGLSDDAADQIRRKILGITT